MHVPRAARDPRPVAAPWRVARVAASSRWWTGALAAALLAPGLKAGAIRASRHRLGPLARRVVAASREEREARDAAREARQRARRAAVARIRAPEADPEVALDAARLLEGKLRARGFQVPPYRAVRAAARRLGKAGLANKAALRQMARRLRVGALLQLDLLTARLTTPRRAGYALPSHWTEGDLERESAEVHARLRIFDEVQGEVVLDRQDRVTLPVPVPPDGGPPGRSPALREAMSLALDHLLIDVGPEGRADDLARAAAGEEGE